jgi:hypothetical protein
MISDLGSERVSPPPDSTSESSRLSHDEEPCSCQFATIVGARIHHALCGHTIITLNESLLGCIFKRERVINDHHCGTVEMDSGLRLRYVDQQ